MGISGDDRLVAFAGVIGPVCGNTADDLIGMDLVKKVRQHGSIPDVAAGDLHHPNLQCFFVNSNVYFTPNTPLCTAMLAGIPFTFALGFDTGAVDEEVQRALGPTIRQAHVQCTLATT